MKTITGFHGYDNINKYCTIVAKGKKGTHADIADKIPCSENTVKNYQNCVNEILIISGIHKETGAFLKHDKKNNTYHFTVKGRLIIGQWAFWETEPGKIEEIPSFLIIKVKDNKFGFYSPTGELIL